MKESTTYQAIVEEGLQEGLAKGAVQEARKLLVRLATKQLGKPTARILAQLEKIGELGRLEALIEQLGSAESWKALLAKDTNQA